MRDEKNEKGLKKAGKIKKKEDGKERNCNIKCRG
jgi:hypothetical protein